MSKDEAFFSRGIEGGGERSKDEAFFSWGVRGAKIE
jgi:hypothetical protein